MLVCIGCVYSNGWMFIKKGPTNVVDPCLRKNFTNRAKTLKTACCYLSMVVHISVSMCLYFWLSGCLVNSLVEFQLLTYRLIKNSEWFIVFRFLFWKLNVTYLKVLWSELHQYQNYSLFVCNFCRMSKKIIADWWNWQLKRWYC